MKKLDVDKVIKEVILEMLEEGDKKLIFLMKQHDLVYGEINEGGFVEDKVRLIMESLGLSSEPKEPTADVKEKNRLLELAGIGGKQ